MAFTSCFPLMRQAHGLAGSPSLSRRHRSQRAPGDGAMSVRLPESRRRARLNLTAREPRRTTEVRTLTSCRAVCLGFGAVLRLIAKMGKFLAGE